MRRLNEAGPSFTKVTEQHWLQALQDERDKLEDKRVTHVTAPRKTKRYKINEIFYTIQGEGILAGSAAVFIRFAACNLSCSWCDTEYDSGVMLEAQTILKAVELVSEPYLPADLPIIVCTGGEPSLQVDWAFVQTFPHHLTMETNGIKWKGEFHNFHTITVSPKTMEGWWLGTDAPSWIVFKVVYDPDNPNMKKIMGAALHLPAKAHFLQPLENQEDGSTNVEMVVEIVKKDPRWRLSLQTHKVLGLR